MDDKMGQCSIYNLITLILSNADNTFLYFPRTHKLLQTLRFILITSFRLLSSFFIPQYDAVKVNSHRYQYHTHTPQNNTAIARALSQLLSTLNDIPVSSRKYEGIRSLADKIIHENHTDGVHALRQVNRVVLSAAFDRALRQLEVTLLEHGEGGGQGDYYRLTLSLRRLVRTVRGGGEGNMSAVTAEKLAAELIWLAHKMADCGCAEEAIRRWAAAVNLGFLALSVEPRLQSSLVKLAAFLFKEAQSMGVDEMEGTKVKLCMQVRLKMLQSWLPLLCRASNGTDAPALSISEKAELERMLENIIEGLEQEEQEQVLSLWLHHFSHCPSSDWPNLHACFDRWCSASRNQLLLLNEN